MRLVRYVKLRYSANCVTPILNKVRLAAGYLPRLPHSDQNYIIAHARSRGIQKYNFGREEYLHLRDLAQKMHLREDLIAELDKDYEFIHRIPKIIRIGRMSAISGICFDAAIRQYSKIAEMIETTEQYFERN